MVGKDLQILRLTKEVEELKEKNDKLRGLYDYVAVELHKAETERDELRPALLGLMKLTAAAYGHQVDLVPEYVAARNAIQSKND